MCGKQDIAATALQTTRGRQRGSTEAVRDALLHAALERNARLLPLDGIRELDADAVALGDVDLGVTAAPVLSVERHFIAFSRQRTDN